MLVAASGAFVLAGNDAELTFVPGAGTPADIWASDEPLVLIVATDARLTSLVASEAALTDIAADDDVLAKIVASFARMTEIEAETN